MATETNVMGRWGKQVDRDDLISIPTPKPLGSRHNPIALSTQIETLQQVIEARNYKHDNWRFFLDQEGHKLLATWTLEQDHERGAFSDNEDIRRYSRPNHEMCGFMLTSTNQSISVRLHTGDVCMLCTNGIESSDYAFIRKSTKHTLVDLRNGAWDMFDSIHVRAKDIYETWSRWDNTELDSRKEEHDLLVQAADDNVINWRDIPHVREHWRNPEHPEFKERNVSNMVQAFTSHQRTKSPFSGGNFSVKLRSFMDSYVDERNPNELSSTA